MLACLCALILMSNLLTWMLVCMHVELSTVYGKIRTHIRKRVQCIKQGTYLVLFTKKKLPEVKTSWHRALIPSVTIDLIDRVLRSNRITWACTGSMAISHKFELHSFLLVQISYSWKRRRWQHGICNPQPFEEFYVYTSKPERDFYFFKGIEHEIRVALNSCQLKVLI
jgi:hypothetical protein